ncbi:hypothetical protein [Paucilactobacillus kaifaensis]|uniref:aggregation-promoting factor C-terminal-like domain-containing protein n=1 Tax=Paucilactobacillus kaifaensis TaxID=2559921 RepID=UPI0010F978A2|nr:hypothetical protein [Paucilactobacillus kaifaensis]
MDINKSNNLRAYKYYLIAGVTLFSLSISGVVSADQKQIGDSDSTSTTVISEKNTASNTNAKSIGFGDSDETAVSNASDAIISESNNSNDNSESGSSDQSSSTAVNESDLGDTDAETLENNETAAKEGYMSSKQPQVIDRISAESTPRVNALSGWKDDSGINYFYKNGEKANGYLNDGSHWYLFKNGIRQSDVQKWAGTYYYFDHSSYVRVDNRYVKSNWGDWYLFGKDGRIMTDVQKWAGTYYYFNHKTYLRADNSYAKSNWGSYYLFGKDGRILTGVQKWAGSYYYFDSSSYLKKTNIKINGYTFNKSGIMVSGVVRSKQSTYYVDQHNGMIESYTSYVSGSNLAAKEWISLHESGGSYTARNGVCYGRYQLNSNYYLNGNYSVVNQEKAADGYVSGRYGSWVNAKKFWLAHHWY